MAPTHLVVSHESVAPVYSELRRFLSKGGYCQRRFCLYPIVFQERLLELKNRQPTLNAMSAAAVLIFLAAKPEKNAVLEISFRDIIVVIDAARFEQLMQTTWRRRTYPHCLAIHLEAIAERIGRTG